MNWRRKITGKLEKKPTMDYIKKFLRAKGLATSDSSENDLTFKLYDYYWRCFYQDDRMALRISFNIGEDVDMYGMLIACNALADERFVVKACIEKHTPKDEDGNPKEVAPEHIIEFSLESFCYTEEMFDKLYEFAVYAISDAIDFHRKKYNEFMENNKNSNQQKAKIGFQIDEQPQEQAPEMKQQRRKIGFV